MRSNLVAKSWVFFGLLSATVSAVIKVTSPQSLVGKFASTDGVIQSQYANFGHIPYGQSLHGRIYFNSSNPTGCEHGSSFTNDLSGDPDNILTPIFMVEATHKCSFVT